MSLYTIYTFEQDVTSFFTRARLAYFNESTDPLAFDSYDDLYTLLNKENQKHGELQQARGGEEPS